MARVRTTILYQMLGVKLSTYPQSNFFARSPCTPRIPPHSRAHVSHCASQAPPRFVDLTVRPDSRRKEFGVSNHLPWDRPRTIMQAITAWYYTPDIGSRNTTKTNLVNYRLQYDSSSLLYSTYFHPRPPFCAPLSPRSPGPSGMPPPTRSGPEPLWIHPRPTWPVVPSQPPVYAARAGKPRPT